MDTSPVVPDTIAGVLLFVTIVSPVHMYLLDGHNKYIGKPITA